jgi:hypothetical protein
MASARALLFGRVDVQIECVADCEQQQHTHQCNDLRIFPLLFDLHQFKRPPDHFGMPAGMLEIRGVKVMQNVSSERVTPVINDFAL